MHRRRLAALAERSERSAHLEGQANTYSGVDVPTNSDANLPNVFEAGNRAAQGPWPTGTRPRLRPAATATPRWLRPSST